MLQLAAAGKTDREMALQLGVSISTVRYYWRRTNQKLGTETRLGAVVEAIRLGIVTVDIAR